MTDFDCEYLRWELDGRVLTVWLARPPVNAVNQAMYLEIESVFAHLDELAPEARCVVLAADGPQFCAGNDLDDFETLTPDNSPERMLRARSAFWAIRDCAVPVVAAIHGAALGTGMAIASSCDFVVASEDAKIGAPEIRVGVLGGGKHLSRLMPPGMVRRMFFTGQAMPASEFLRFGGVVEVVERARLLDRAQELAREIAGHSPVALRAAKRALNEVEYLSLKPGYEFEQSLTTELSSHPHAKEALHAFRERRDPVYG